MKKFLMWTGYFAIGITMLVCLNWIAETHVDLAIIFAMICGQTLNIIQETISKPEIKQKGVKE